jgi:transposase-like protein
MKRTKHSADQIILKLKTAEQLIVQVKIVVEVCRVIELTQPTYHRWRQHYGVILSKEARRLTQLQKEHARLKKRLPEAELENVMLKDLAEVNFGARNAACGPSRFRRIVNGLLNGLSAGWWRNTAVVSAMGAWSSTSRRPSCANASG